MTLQQAYDILENAIDKLVEVGNGTTDDEARAQATELIKIRDFISQLEKHTMTITEITRHLEAKTPIPGLTDPQQANAQALYDTGRVRDAQQYVKKILEPEVKKTLL